MPNRPGPAPQTPPCTGTAPRGWRRRRCTRTGSQGHSGSAGPGWASAPAAGRACAPAAPRRCRRAARQGPRRRGGSRPRSRPTTRPRRAARRSCRSPALLATRTRAGCACCAARGAGGGAGTTGRRARATLGRRRGWRGRGSCWVLPRCVSARSACATPGQGRDRRCLSSLLPWAGWCTATPTRARVAPIV